MPISEANRRHQDAAGGGELDERRTGPGRSGRSAVLVASPAGSLKGIDAMGEDVPDNPASFLSGHSIKPQLSGKRPERIHGILHPRAKLLNVRFQSLTISRDPAHGVHEVLSLPSRHRCAIPLGLQPSFAFPFR